MDTGKAQQAAKNAGLSAAIRVAGGQSALAKSIGRSQATVWEWEQRTGRVSAEDAIAIERETGVPAESISPAVRQYAAMRGLKQRLAP